MVQVQPVKRALQLDLPFPKQALVLSPGPVRQAEQHLSSPFRISQSEITPGSRKRLFKLVIKDHGNKVVLARESLQRVRGQHLFLGDKIRNTKQQAGGPQPRTQVVQRPKQVRPARTGADIPQGLQNLPDLRQPLFRR